MRKQGLVIGLSALLIVLSLGFSIGKDENICLTLLNLVGSNLGISLNLIRDCLAALIFALNMLSSITLVILASYFDSRAARNVFYSLVSVFMVVFLCCVSAERFYNLYEIQVTVTNATKLIFTSWVYSTTLFVFYVDFILRGLEFNIFSRLYLAQKRLEEKPNQEQNQLLLKYIEELYEGNHIIDFEEAPNAKHM